MYSGFSKSAGQLVALVEHPSIDAFLSVVSRRVRLVGVAQRHMILSILTSHYNRRFIIEYFMLQSKTS